MVVLIGGFSLTSVYGQAQTSTTTMRVPFSTELNLCPFEGEFVQVSGNALFVLHTTVPNNDDGGSVKVTHFNTQGLKGTTESGEPVRVSQVAQGVSTQETPNSGHFHTTVHLTIAVEGKPNAVVISTINTIINPDGTTKTEHTHTDVQCVG